MEFRSKNTLYNNPSDVYSTMVHKNIGQFDLEDTIEEKDIGGDIHRNMWTRLRKANSTSSLYRTRTLNRWLELNNSHPETRLTVPGHTVERVCLNAQAQE